MSDEQRQHVQVAQAETSSTSEPPKWGELPPPERIAELETRLADWEQLPAVARGDPASDEGRSAFDQRGPLPWPGFLAGADVFYLAARALAGSAEPSAIAAAADRLRSEVEAEQFFLDLSTLYLVGARLDGAHLEDANLGEAHLEDARLGRAQLEGAFLVRAHLVGAVLSRARLEGANLNGAHLEGAFLVRAHLEGSELDGARLEGSDLRGARLEGANLDRARLEGADLRGATFDKTSHLNDAVLTGASFDQVTFDNTNLAVVDWSQVDILGDERTARKRRHSDGKPKTRAQRRDDYKAAVRANRVLAVALQAQGLTEDAARYAYRAQIMQRRVLFYQRKPGAYLFSVLLAVLAGYGYRLWRIAAAYAVVLLAFATAYFATGIITDSPMPWYHALLISFTAIHGRVFLGQFGLDSPLSWIAGIEAVTGIVIEGVFVAMLIQRFFGR